MGKKKLLIAQEMDNVSWALFRSIPVVRHRRLVVVPKTKIRM
jgi:hypothetical protein